MTNEGTGEYIIALHWHLIDADWDWVVSGQTIQADLPCGRIRISLTCPGTSLAGAELRRGSDATDDSLGWESLYYGERSPRPVLRLVRKEGPAVSDPDRHPA